MPVETPAVSSRVAHPHGTIPVTVRLDPLRFSRIGEVSVALRLTKQSILTEALDRRLPALQRRAHNIRMAQAQPTLFDDHPAETELDSGPDIADTRRGDGTIATGHRVSPKMHRWLHAEAQRRGMTVQAVITAALVEAGGPSNS